MKGRNLGLSVAGFALLASAYEFIGIADGNGGVPTISRVVQGIRDTGTVGQVGVAALTGAIAIALLSFGGWLMKHFLRDHRSSL